MDREGARFGSLAALLCAAATTCGACSPVEMARTAYVAHPGRGSISANTSLTFTHTQATYVSASQSGTASGDGGSIVGWDNPVAPAAYVGLLELGGAYGVFPGCELGGSVRVLGIHGEGRCQLIGYGKTEPFALAASAGGGAWVFGMGPYGRIGVDSTISFRRPALLIGGYARFGRRLHSLVDTSLPSDPDFESGHCCEVFPSDEPMLEIEQNELRLSVPIGVAWLTGRSDRGNATRLVLGAVPSFVVYAADRSSRCANDCEPGLRATDYSEDYTVAATARLEWGGTD